KLLVPLLYHLPWFSDDRRLLLFGQAREHRRIGQAMAHQFPLQLRHFLHDARIEPADLGIERDGAAYIVLRKRLHDPPHADPVTVVAARMIADVGRVTADLDME